MFFARGYSPGSIGDNIMPAGQPTTYSEAFVKTICDRLVNGESLNKICSDKDLPCKATVYNWLSNPDHETFLDKYTHARERQAETFMDECVDIADDSENDTVTLVNKDGSEYEKVNHDHINRSRLRVDTRIKIAERMAPRKYAIQHLEVSGPDKGPIEVSTPEETLRRLAFMLRNKEEGNQGG